MNPLESKSDDTSSVVGLQLWVVPTAIAVSFDLFIYSGSGGRLRAVLPEHSDVILGLGFQEHRAHSEWTVPDRAAMERYRDKSSQFHHSAQAVMIQPQQLADYLVKNHLKSLELPGPQIFELKFNDRNQLTPLCLRALKKIHPTFYDTLYSQYIKEACLMV